MAGIGSVARVGISSSLVRAASQSCHIKADDNSWGLDFFETVNREKFRL